MAARRSAGRSRRPRLPAGHLTFLFTDIGGSTRLFQRLGDAWPDVLRSHDAALESAFADNGGIVLSHEGDGYFAVFESAADAVRGIAAGQAALGSMAWPPAGEVSVRAGLHTGYAMPYDGSYVALAVHQAARVGRAAHPGQTLVTNATLEAAGADWPDQLWAHPLGPHRLKDFDVPQLLYELRGPGLRSDFPPLAAIWRGANNLPVERTTFVGRSRDVEQVEALVDRSRLVTLVGPGGVGKTRLAAHTAAAMLDGSGDGVWLVPLSTVSDDSGVAPAALRALGAGAEGDDPVEALIRAVGDRRLLLILDNCEHVLDGCAQTVDRLLEHCPSSYVLATSRQPLDVAGEQLYRLAPLETPPAAVPLTPQEAVGYESVQLFLDRAVQHAPSFVLDDATLPAVVTICRRLEGLPLAVELAAARLRTLSVDAIAARVDDQLGLLVGGQRGGQTRQQTVRALIDWSFRLLEPDERALLAELSVFAGGWTLDAVESVCTSDRPVVDLLGSLVDKSLVRTESVAGDLRYSLLETVRQFAAEQLHADAAWSEAVAARHARHYLEVAEKARRELNTPLQRSWLDRLDLEAANIGAALDRALSVPDLAELAARMLAAMASYWVLRGRAGEGRRLVADVLRAAEASPVPPAVLARALIGAGTLFNRSGEFARARDVLEEALGIARHCEDRRSVAVALNDLAWLANRRDELDVAAAFAGEALATAEAEHEVHLAGRVHATLGDLAERAHDLAAARRHFERAEEMLASVGDRVGAAKVANNLGLVDMMLGDLPRARRAMEICLGVFSELQDAASLPTVLSNLGVIALAEGEPGQAGELFSRALRLGRNAGDTELVVYATLGLAVTAGDTGDEERAATLHGVVDALAGQMELTLDALEQDLRDRSRDRVQQSLGPAEFDALVRRGALMSPEVAVAYALGGDASPLAAAPQH